MLWQTIYHERHCRPSACRYGTSIQQEQGHLRLEDAPHRAGAPITMQRWPCEERCFIFSLSLFSLFEVAFCGTCQETSTVNFLKALISVHFTNFLRLVKDSRDYVQNIKFFHTQILLCSESATKENNWEPNPQTSHAIAQLLRYSATITWLDCLSSHCSSMCGLCSFSQPGPTFRKAHNDISGTLKQQYRN